MDGHRFDSLSRSFAHHQSRRATLRQLSLAGALVGLLARVPQTTRALPVRQLECPPSTPLCGDACVDLQTDPSNCGACGLACDADQACRFGFCGPVPACDGPLVLCGDECVDLQTDQRHCGWCDTLCQAWEHCTAGVCIEDPLPPCDVTQIRCDDVCVNFLSDDMNCGDCGRACQLFVTECREGRCVVIEEPHIPL